MKCYWAVETSERDFYAGPKSRAKAIQRKHGGRIYNVCDKGLSGLEPRKSTLEIERYRRLMWQQCKARRRVCVGEQRKACRALQTLIGKLRRGQSVDAQRDVVRESMFQLNRCRHRYGEVGFHGLR